MCKQMIRENLKAVRQNIEDAAKRSGRDPGVVRLIVVTKEAGIAQIDEAVSCGVREIGENRVQDALKKFSFIDGSVTRHFIGHLQTNKTKEAVRVFHLIHSVDSVRLARAIDKETVKLDKVQDVLVQVNVSAEETKFGISPEDVLPVVEELSRLPNIRVLGLMTITPLVKDPEQARPYFRRLRELALDVDRRKIKGIQMGHLSMGMTQDYMVAVEEGATMVRIGRAIFKT